VILSQDHFKRLMRAAALSADAVVPVIGSPTLSSNLPDAEGFFRKEWTKLISAVVVTKIKQKRVQVDLKEDLSLTTWGRVDRVKDVLCCDSLLGLGGLRLRDYLAKGQDIPTRFQDRSDPISEVWGTACVDRV
jgi:hypothetical protein